MTVVTMTTAHVRDPGPVIATWEAIEAEIAGGTLLSASGETAQRRAEPGPRRGTGRIAPAIAHTANHRHCQRPLSGY
jgi:hypothetical protein